MEEAHSLMEEMHSLMGEAHSLMEEMYSLMVEFTVWPGRHPLNRERHQGSRRTQGGVWEPKGREPPSEVEGDVAQRSALDSSSQ